MTTTTRITELANELTSGIDGLEPDAILRTLRQTDAQLFSGWGGRPGIMDEPFVSETTTLSQVVASLLSDNQHRSKAGLPLNRIIFTGCGTSGRVAWLCARSFNRLLLERHPSIQSCFHYLISGGDESLVISKELPEDDPLLGQRELTAMLGTAAAQAGDAQPKHVFIGITCGLSAPFVAGQVEWAMAQPNVVCALIGFNPTSLARNAPVENWDKTCRQVFEALQDRSNAERATGADEPAAKRSESASAFASRRSFVLNPIVGPEPITGSSRMKGGSMTHILLNLVCVPAIESLGDVQKLQQARATLQSELQIAVFDAYSNISKAAQLLKQAGTALSREGRLLYVAADDAGLIGLMDASEMVDTYGCRDDEVRAFIEGGWTVFSNNEGDLSQKGWQFQLSFEDFRRDILSTLSESDFVLCSAIGDPSEALLSLISDMAATRASVGLVALQSRTLGSEGLPSLPGKVIACPLPCLSQSMFAAQLTHKLVLNGISTGANILKGAVYGNSMINLTVSNNKLFHRSAEIVQQIVGCSLEVATDALFRAIYKKDTVEESVKGKPLSTHIEVATPQRFVVPLAVLLATGRVGLEAAQSLLQQGTSLSNMIKQALKA